MRQSVQFIGRHGGLCGGLTGFFCHAGNVFNIFCQHNACMALLFQCLKNPLCLYTNAANGVLQRLDVLSYRIGLATALFKLAACLCQGLGDAGNIMANILHHATDLMG